MTPSSGGAGLDHPSQCSMLPRVLSAFSQVVSPRLAARFGLIETIVFTHLPANVCLVAAAFMPNAMLAVAFLLLRMAFSQMDVPARQSYVMAVVRARDRSAGAVWCWRATPPGPSRRAGR